MHIHKNAFFVSQLFVLVELVVQLQWSYRAVFAILIEIARLVLCQKVNVVLLFPSGPNEVTVCKIFPRCFLPPVSLLQHAFDHSRVVSGPNPKSFCLPNNNSFRRDVSIGCLNIICNFLNVLMI
jgi:hypothetical protein